MGYRPGDDTYEFEGRVEFTTAKAHLVIPTIGPSEIWVPKSQLVSMTEADPDGNRMFEVTYWWFNHSDMKDYK